MRVSSYNIYVELKNSSNYYFLVHGYTGAIDLIDKNIALQLKSANVNQIPSEISENTMELLIKRGYITNKTKEEERKYLKDISDLIQRKEKKLNSFRFMVTHDCNFRCPYCFENELSNNGASWSKSVFTKEMVDQAYAAIDEIQPNREHIINSIGLYGGEPLLKENLDIIKYIIAKGQDKGFSFRAITNGYDLNHFTSVLGDKAINWLQISIDGLKETNNKRRVHYKNKDSFTKIMDNILIALEKGVKVMTRINIDKSNVDEIEGLMEYFNDRGFMNYKNFTPYVAKIIQNESNCEDNCGQVLSSKEFYNKVFTLREKNPELNNFFVSDNDIKRNLKKNIAGNSLFMPRTKFCGANKGTFILDSNGDIYTCGEKIGDKKHVVGSFNNGLNFNEDSLNNWHNRTVGNIDQCSNCKYAFWCGGGCAAGINQKNGEGINRSNCQGFSNVFSEMVNDLFDKEYSKKLELQY